MSLKNYLEDIARRNKVAPYRAIFDENCVEDVDENIIVLDIARRELKNKFSIDIEEPNVLGTIFYVAWNAMIEHVVEMESEYKNYQLCVCDRLIIGFDNDDNDENEKVGNFALQIIDMDHIVDPSDIMDPSITAKEKCVRWNAENTVNQPEQLMQISIRIQKLLQIVDLLLASPETVLPIFIIIYQQLIQYIKYYRESNDKFEYCINFMGCFKIYARQNEDDGSDITIMPSIADKLIAKNDKEANKIQD